MQKIDIFPWSDHFNTGITQIDEQHRKLVVLLNRLATSVAYSVDAEELNNIFDELTDYTLYHFQTEESIWHQYLPDDPLESEHHAVHQEFVSTVLHFKAEQAERPTTELAKEALSFLAKWLASHIVETDRHMAYIILALGEGYTLVQAKEIAQGKMAGTTRVLIDIILSIYTTLASNTLDLMHEMKDHLRASKELERERILLQTILDNAPMGIWLTTPEGKVQFTNKTLCVKTGIAEKQFLEAEHYADLLLPDNASNCIRSDKECLDISSNHISTETIPFVDGKEHLVEITKVNLSNVSRVRGIVGLAIDITEEKLAQEALQRQKEELESIFNISRDGISILDMESNFMNCNEAYLKMTGFTREELLSKSCLSLSIPADYQKSVQALETTIDKGFIENFEKTCIVKNEKCLTANMTMVLMPDKQRILAVTRDVTEARAQENKIRYMAHYDILTELPNRVLLSDRLHQAMVQAQRSDSILAVVYLDLDGFKEVNDSYGHETGDILLTTLAHRMKMTLREGDTIARLGGDEFVAVLRDLKDHQDSVLLLKRLLSAASTPVIANKLSLSISASLGVSFYEKGNDITSDQLLRQADQAMYQAKLSGKNRYHIFDVVQDQSIRTRHESLDAIEKALINDEFELYYQPKVNMRSGKIIGAEALIRWNHPHEGVLSPAKFLPIIEGHILSVQVGDWVMEQAMTQIEQFRDEGVDLPISINVDALQLQQNDFVEKLKNMLSRHPGVREGDLELEILETSALEDIDHLSHVMEMCHQIGVHFSLDDFGTGYSSLTYLKRLPARQLKIDQSFVKGMLNDPDDLAILDGVIGLSVAFRRDIIAEGVESIEHGEMLLRLGCENAQGYVIAKPMPPEALTQWMKEWTPDPLWHNVKRTKRDDIQLLFAEVEHRSWLQTVLFYLNGERQTLPILDANECHFGEWLNNNGQQLYLNCPSYSEMQTTHQRVHQIVKEMIEGTNINTSVSQKQIDELHLASDRLIILLKELQSEACSQL